MNKFKLVNVPGNVSYLSKEANDNKLRGVDLLLELNEESFHVSASKALVDNYYDDYLMTTSYSESQKKLQMDQILVLGRLIGESKDKKLLEVGCGDGHFLEVAKSRFMKVEGIEPSLRFCEKAREKGLSVYNIYMNDCEADKLKDTYDCIVSRQVFEHLESPGEMLRCFFKMLKNNGIGLIEVPNGLKSLKEARFYDFFPDHVQYYSINSLSQLVAGAGFEILKCQTAFGEDYIEIYFRKIDQKLINLQELESNKDRCLRAVENFVISQQGSIAVWGAGAKAQVVFWGLSDLVKAKICNVIDSDPNKNGKYLPRSNVKVTLLENINRQPSIILILALSYVDEIYKTIKNYNQSIEVFVLKNDEIINLK